MAEYRTPSAWGPRRPQPAEEQTFNPDRNTPGTPAVRAQWVKEYKLFIGVLASAMAPDELMHMVREARADIFRAYNTGI